MTAEKRLALLDNLPPVLRDRDQWVLWRAEEVDGRRTKVPYQALAPDRRASSTDAKTWASYREARALYSAGAADGIGFVFSSGDPYVGIDIDACVLRGLVSPLASELIGRAGSYAEVSPSGTGIHIIVRGNLPQAVKTREIEMYSAGRYFTCTGALAGNCRGITDASELLAELVERYGSRIRPAELRAVKRVEVSQDRIRGLLRGPLRDVWDRQDARLLHADGTPDLSRHDARLAVGALSAGWSEGEAAWLISAFRAKVGSDKIQRNYQYLARTMAYARAAVTENGRGL